MQRCHPTHRLRQSLTSQPSFQARAATGEPSQPAHQLDRSPAAAAAAAATIALGMRQNGTTPTAPGTHPGGIRTKEVRGARLKPRKQKRTRPSLPKMAHCPMRLQGQALLGDENLSRHGIGRRRQRAACWFDPENTPLCPRRIGQTGWPAGVAFPSIGSKATCVSRFELSPSSPSSREVAAPPEQDDRPRCDISLTRRGRPPRRAIHTRPSGSIEARPDGVMCHAGRH
jgi:hypothetical protein